MNTLTTITEPDGTIHAIERRTCDLDILYTPWELTQLILGMEVHRFPRWHDAGRETHVFPEAVAERLAGERETPLQVAARYRKAFPLIGLYGVIGAGLWLVALMVGLGVV
jgi:hypothetical protein